jgi:RNA polymerase sigma-70 factor (ECF subfamily)
MGRERIDTRDAIPGGASRGSKVVVAPFDGVTLEKGAGQSAPDAGSADSWSKVPTARWRRDTNRRTAVRRLLTTRQLGNVATADIEPPSSSRPRHDRPLVEESGSPPSSQGARPASFRSIYDAYIDFVWVCARRLGVPPGAIEDVAQEVFTVIHCRLHTLQRPESLRSWIYGVVRRTVSAYHRARRTRSAREEPGAAVADSVDPMQPSPLDLALLSDEVKLLWRLLGELDPPKREVLVLVELEEMTVPEIADAIGVPLNTAYSRLRAARREFNDAHLRVTAREEVGE